MIEIKIINNIKYIRNTIDTIKNGRVIKSIMEFNPSIPFNVDFTNGNIIPTIKRRDKIKKIIYIDKKMVNFIMESKI